MRASNNFSKILIIEDSSDDETLLLRQLDRAGLGRHIMTINDGLTALEYFTCRTNKSEHLAAIFLDLNLSRLSGLSLLEFVKNEKRLADVPVIVMTSSHRYDDLGACRGLGVDDYVSRPLTFSSFTKAFADTFHSRRARNSDAPARTVLAE